MLHKYKREPCQENLLSPPNALSPQVNETRAICINQERCYHHWIRFDIADPTFRSAVHFVLQLYSEPVLFFVSRMLQVQPSSARQEESAYVRKGGYASVGNSSGVSRFASSRINVTLFVKLEVARYTLLRLCSTITWESVPSC